MKRSKKLLSLVSTMALNFCLAPAACAQKAKEEKPTPKKPAVVARDPRARKTRSNDEMLDAVQKATFQWFVDNQNPTTGLILDRSKQEHDPCTIAGTGFGLTVYAIAAERGWISRAEATAYTLKVVRNLYSTPQGPEAEGISGFHGFYYHFLDPQTGLRARAPNFWNSELSSIDTALLMAGVLFARNYYDGNNVDEAAVRKICDALYDRVEWTWLLKSDGTIGHGYTPESGMIEHVYKGYSEAVLLYILAISSTQHPVPASSWNALIGDAKASRPDRFGQKMIMLPGMPLFTYQYPLVWLDFRGIRDEINRRCGFDYFENSRRATRAQWRYAKKNAAGRRGYGRLDWGLTASDGPGWVTKTIDGQEVTFRAYSERGAPGGFDDGTIAPTAAIGSVPFAPKIVLPTIRHWLKTRPELFNEHGFVDAFNPTFDESENSGWVDSDRLSIDQGPIMTMIENYRSGLVWNVMRRDIRLRDGLRRAGFEGGWLK